MGGEKAVGETEEGRRARAQVSWAFGKTTLCFRGSHPRTETSPYAAEHCCCRATSCWREHDEWGEISFANRNSSYSPDNTLQMGVGSSTVYGQERMCMWQLRGSTFQAVACDGPDQGFSFAVRPASSLTIGVRYWISRAIERD